jgi:hypothetical protein
MATEDILKSVKVDAANLCFRSLAFRGGIKFPLCYSQFINRLYFKKF